MKLKEQEAEQARIRKQEAKVLKEQEAEQAGVWDALAEQEQSIREALVRVQEVMAAREQEVKQAMLLEQEAFQAKEQEAEQELAEQQVALQQSIQKGWRSSENESSAGALPAESKVWKDRAERQQSLQSQLAAAQKALSSKSDLVSPSQAESREAQAPAETSSAVQSAKAKLASAEAKLAMMKEKREANRSNEPWIQEKLQQMEATLERMTSEMASHVTAQRIASSASNESAEEAQKENATKERHATYMRYWRGLGNRKRCGTEIYNKCRKAGCGVFDLWLECREDWNMVSIQYQRWEQIKSSKFNIENYMTYDQLVKRYKNNEVADAIVEEKKKVAIGLCPILRHPTSRQRHSTYAGRQAHPMSHWKANRLGARPYVHTYIHAYIHTHIKNTHACMRMHAYTRAAYTQTNKDTYVYIQRHTLTIIHIHTDIRTRIHAYTHTHNTDTHVYTHVRTNI